MKNLSLIIISILCLTFLTGCMEKNELNQYAYVVALGFDKSKTNPENISITFEFVIPIEFLNDSSTTSELSSITTVEASDLYSAINLVNTYISKEVNLAHNKIIVFSEALAYDGLENYINTISNDKNFRTNMYLLISKCEAKEYITKTTPELEKNPAKFYELLLNNYKHNSILTNSYFLGHLLANQSTYANSIALLANINTTNDSNPNIQQYANIESTNTDMSYIAGAVPKEGSSNTEILGLAVFKDYKLIGELTGEETLYYLILNNKFKEVYYSIYDPFINTNTIIFKLTPKKKTTMKVSYINGKPLIKTNSALTANIISISTKINYNNKENIAILEKELENVLETNIESFLYKTSKELKSDIVGFGKTAARNYLSWEEWTKSSWLSKYEFANFSTNINIDIEKSGLLFTQ